MADAEAAARPAMSTFERYLSVWVLICIVVWGVAMIGFGLAVGAATLVQGGVLLGASR